MQCLRLRSIRATIAGVVCGATLASTSMAATFDFNIQAVGNATPETSVATLSLIDTVNGVQFTLTPNASNPNFTQGVTHIDKLWLAYNGSPLTGGNINENGNAPQTAGSFTWNSDSPIDSFTYDGNGHNEAGYSPLRIEIEFPSQNNHPELWFLTNETSTWTIAGTQVSDFVNALVNPNSPQKPGPAHGVLSIQGLHGGSSNWVDAAPVPEPGSWAMMVAGLIGVAGMARRRLR